MSVESSKTTSQQGSTERRVCKPKEGMDGAPVPNSLAFPVLYSKAHLSHKPSVSDGKTKRM